MAKGARASSRKRNNAALRAKVFGPAHDARTERLSAKLQELVSKPKPAEERAMQVDSTSAADEDQANIRDAKIVDEMDIDNQKTSSTPKRKHGKSKIEKKKKAPRKAKNAIVFPALTRKRQGPGLKKK